MVQWQSLLVILTILRIINTENTTQDTSMNLVEIDDVIHTGADYTKNLKNITEENFGVINNTETSTTIDGNLFVTKSARVIANFHEPSFLGTFFEDGDEPLNISAKLGTTVILDCKIGLLYDKTVSWLRRKGDTIHLLSVGRHTYSVDERIQLSFRYPNNWRLQITSVTRRDDGLYECQVAGQPSIVKSIYLKILAPEVQILDEKGIPVSERYYKAGSTIKLSCVVKQTEGNPAENIVWNSGNIILSMGITIISRPGEIISNLKIPSAQKHLSGKYTCTVDQLASASITLHILNGELPAAIHGKSTTSKTSSLCLLSSFSITLIANKYAFPHR